MGKKRRSLPAETGETDSFVKAEDADTWRAFLKCVFSPDSTPPANAKCVDRLMGCVRDAPDDTAVANVLSAFLRETIEVLSADDGDANSPIAAFILCCFIIKVSESPISSASLLRERVTQRDPDEYESILHSLLQVILAQSSYRPDFHLEVAPGVPFSKWLQSVTTYIWENSLPVPVTTITVLCVRDLLALNPQVVEHVVGQIAAVVLFNIDHVDAAPFFEDLLVAYGKLRQVPKLVAKLYQAVGTTEQVTVTPLDTTCLSLMAQAASRLPAVQATEVWKTVLYHLSPSAEDKSVPPSENVLLLTDQLLPTFLRHVAVVDHSIPSTVLDKVKDLAGHLIRRVRDLPALKRVSLELDELAIVLNHYRSSDIPGSDSMNGLQRLKTSILTGKKCDTKKLLKQLSQTEILSNLDLLLLAGLSPQDVLSVTKCCVSSSDKTSRELLLSSPVLQESVLLQTGVVANLLEHVAEVLDMEVAVADVLKPINKNPAQLFNLAEESTSQLIKKCFSKLAQVALKENSNLELDPRFYFELPVSVLERLPLESLHPTLHCCVVLLDLLLLSLSTHDAASHRLWAVLVRSLDHAHRQPEALRMINAADLLFWMAKLRYYTDVSNAEAAQRLIAQFAVKHIREFEQPGNNFGQTLDKLAFNLKSLDNDKSLLTSVKVLEALEAPLVHRDAAKEKIVTCEAHFEHFAACAAKGFLKFASQSDATKALQLRAATSVVCVLSAKGCQNEKEESLWAGHVAVAFEHALRVLSDHSASTDESAIARPMRRFLKAVLGATKGLRAALPRKFSRKIWKLLSFENRDAALLSSGLLLDILVAVEENEVKHLLEKLLEATDTCEPSRSEGYIMAWGKVALLRDDSDSVEMRRGLVERALHVLRLRCLSRPDCVEEVVVPMLTLEALLLETEKPVVSRESECRSLSTALSLNLSSVASACDLRVFLEAWRGVSGVASVAFQRRPGAVVIPRIPVLLAVLRNLVSGLVVAADQRTARTPLQIKELALCAHHIDRLMEHVKKHKEDFARIAPYVVADVFISLQKTTLYPAVRANLVFAINKLLDICDKHSKEFLVASLPEGTKDVYKQFVETYNRYHRYSGKV